jgi:DNA-binding HxlR family transcriptional regulator
MDAHESPDCRNFKVAIDLITKPWAGFILRALQRGPLRFNELVSAIEGIGEKTLSARLKELEALGLLTRRVHPTTPVRVEYELTCKGASFQRVVDAIIGWGAEISESPKKAG